MGISTHILDTALGRPAAGVAVTLEKLKEGTWFEFKKARQGGRWPRQVAAARGRGVATGNLSGALCDCCLLCDAGSEGTLPLCRDCVRDHRDLAALPHPVAANRQQLHHSPRKLDDDRTRRK